MLHAVIMAGGSGTRFWPASRKLVPKQLLALSGERTMLQSTVDRLGALVPPERQLVLTNRVLTKAVCEQLPDLPADNVVGEPCKRDTAPCIGLAAALIHRVDPEGTMAVMPSDHVISSHEQFQAAIAAGKELIDLDPTRIVTFGIRPTYPAESFGYIQRGKRIDAAKTVDAYEVETFREKPDRATAEQYLAAGTFYWNSGIFLWRASTILDALKKNVPEMYRHIEAIAASMGTDSYESTLEKEFTAIEGKSIDYAVMEGYDNVVTIEAPFSWDDVGSWQALSRLREPDANDNTVVGSHVGIDTRGSIVMTRPGHTVVTIDVRRLDHRANCGCHTCRPQTRRGASPRGRETARARKANRVALVLACHVDDGRSSSVAIVRLLEVRISKADVGSFAAFLTSLGETRLRYVSLVGESNASRARRPAGLGAAIAVAIATHGRSRDRIAWCLPDAPMLGVVRGPFGRRRFRRHEPIVAAGPTARIPTVA